MQCGWGDQSPLTSDSDREEVGDVLASVPASGSLVPQVARLYLPGSISICKMPNSGSFQETVSFLSRKYKIRDQGKLYFVTFTVIHWRILLSSRTGITQ
jgi:hypothetical protein